MSNTTTFAVSNQGNFWQFAPASGATIVIGLCKFTVSVLVQNASHKAWKGMGRQFWGKDLREQIAKARLAYKSASVQAALDLFEQMVQA